MAGPGATRRHGTVFWVAAIVVVLLGASHCQASRPSIMMAPQDLLSRAARQMLVSQGAQQ